MPARGRVRLGNFSGSSQKEIDEESEWGAGHNHRVGFRNNADRVAGFTHDRDHQEEEDEDHKFTENAVHKYREMRERAGEGKLLDFQNVMRGQSVGHEHLELSCEILTMHVLGFPPTSTTKLPTRMAFHGSQLRRLDQV